MNSIWINSIKNKNNFKTLGGNKKSDICIVGAGIFGLTCAYYLTNLGYKVIVIDKFDIGEKTTGHTTGKITSQHGLFYNYLISSYGKKFAKDYLEANEKAIINIKKIIDTEKINCDFKYENSYVYTTKKAELSNIKKEISALESIDFNCDFVTKTGLPFEIEGAICFKNQAQFNPLKYLIGLCQSIVKNGGEIFNYTTAYDVKETDDKCITYTSNGEIQSKYVVMATHYPFINIPGFYFTKMYQSTSYIIAVDTKKTLFNGMYINPTSPIFSYRTTEFNGRKLLLIGGSDHNTGKPTSYQDSYGILEDEAKKFYPDCEVLYRWNTEDCISLDKIPYIGRYSNITSNIFVATGFKKWGITSSNVAANIIVDKILGKENKYEYVFDSTRIKPIKNIDEVKNIVVQSTNSLFLDKLKHPDMDFDSIANNSGSIIEINGQKIGIYKDSSGNIYPVKPICTHLGCLLSWNDVDKTWDCPCHGSRFDFMGRNLYNPAFKNLEIYNLEN